MKLTPMMQQYMGFKEQYPDKILLFRMGDFYETFGDDAAKAAKILNITLTKRGKAADAMPLAGFPHHSLDQYLRKIISVGESAVIVDQLEDPKQAKGIVKRGVTRVVTPGTLDGEHAQETKNAYLGSFYKEKKNLGVALLDLSTGEVLYTDLPFNKESIDQVLNSYSPAEAVIMTGETDMSFNNIPVQPVDKGFANKEFSQEVLKKFYESKTLEGIGIDKEKASVVALAMALSYVEETQKMTPEHIQVPKRFNINGTMVLDRATIRNLELVGNSRDGGIKGSLLEVIDNTNTLMGRRMIYSWILNPLLELEDINKRLDTVEKFNKDSNLQSLVQEKLNEVNDIERIVGKIGLNRSNARDLKALQISLERIRELTSAFKSVKDIAPKLLAKDTQKALKKLITLLDTAIVDSPPVTIMDGRIIKKGYNKEVDELRTITGDSKGWIESFVESEQERTGIPSLKVGFNKVFGYFIEVTATHKDKVPDDYIRKQTLVNSERYITEDLKEKETIILGAEDKLGALEYKLFQEIRGELLPHIEMLQDISREVASVDILSGFAKLARDNDYNRPTLSNYGENDGILDIEDGRHPIVENMSEEAFISNDTHLNEKDVRMAILTGPNMSGKSTYIRQVAVIALMAQIGCFVPAAKADISLVDRIFTRVGASDDLGGGRSTFMVEMDEAANIVNNATKYSLVILDEVGRGTSTYDGVSIAWSLAEHLVKDIKARTLFATHYHELLKLPEKIGSGVKNFNVLVEEDVEEGSVIFLRKIVEGGTDRSYGIYVAKMAGLPEKVIKRANEILESFEQESMFAREGEIRDVKFDKKKNGNGNGNGKRKQSVAQIPMFEIGQSEVEKEIRDMNLDELTPLEALNMIAKWRKKV